MFFCRGGLFKWFFHFFVDSECSCVSWMLAVCQWPMFPLEWQRASVDASAGVQILTRWWWCLCGAPDLCLVCLCRGRAWVNGPLTSEDTKEEERLKLRLRFVA